MPYGDLVAQRVQRFAAWRISTGTRRRWRSARTTSRISGAGWSCGPGVDYEAIVAEAQKEASVIIWDGGNNDFSFLRSDLEIVVVDPIAARARTGVSPGRDEPAPRRHRGDQQGEQRLPAERRHGDREHPRGEPAMP